MSGEKRPDEAEDPSVAAPWRDQAEAAGALTPQAPADSETSDEAMADGAPGDPVADAESAAPHFEFDPVRDEAGPARGDDEGAGGVEAEALAAGAAMAAAASAVHQDDDPRPAQAAPQQPAAPARGGFAGKALTGLVLLIAGGAGAIWAAPQVAPMLPAPVAAWLKPAGQGPDLAAVQAEIAAAMVAPTAAAEAAQAQAAALADRLAALEAAPPAVGPEALEALAARVAALEAAPAGGGGGGGGDGAWRSEAEALRAQIAGVAQQIGEGPDLGAIESRLGALDAGLSPLAEQVAALEDGLSPLAERIAALEAVRESDAAARDEALAGVARARRDAQLAAAMAEIDRAMILGQPFDAALASAVEALGTEPPAALAAAAPAGAPTREALKASFADAAHAAIAATLKNDPANEGLIGSLFASVQARATGLPSAAIEGDDARAVLSRAREALLNGDLDAAMAGVAALPEPAQAAMADWTAGARLRAEADAAMVAWRADIKTAE